MDPDEIVRARLRAVLADGVGDETSAGTPAPPSGARVSPPWAPPPADRTRADDDWPPSAGPTGPPPDVPAVRPVDYAPSGARLPSIGDPPSVSPAGAFGPAGTRSRWLAPIDPGRRGVRALAAVAVLVVVVAAFLAWRARPRVDQVAAPPVEAQPVAASAGDPPRGEPAGSSSAAPIVVAVGGRVRRPGLVRLPPGSRVADAIQAAGGADAGVDVATLNLARKVVDGELILVGVTAPPGADPAGGAAGQPAAGGALAGARVNLNTATLAELDSLPGVGPVLAQRILDAREAQGGFTSVSDLRKVDGIGDSRYEQLKDLVVV